MYSESVLKARTLAKRNLVDMIYKNTKDATGCITHK